jgi:hypothetical protein
VISILVVTCELVICVFYSISNRVSPVAVVLFVAAVRPVDTGISENYYGVRGCIAVLRVLGSSTKCKREKEVLGIVCI